MKRLSEGGRENRERVCVSVCGGEREKLCVCGWVCCVSGYVCVDTALCLLHAHVNMCGCISALACIGMENPMELT